MTELLLGVRRKGGTIELAPLPRDSGESIETVTLNFAEADRKILKTYLERCGRLRQALEPFADFSLHISATINAPVVLRANLPSVSEINSFLMEMRPFILVKEPTYFNKVNNILSRGISIREFQEAARDWRKEFTNPDLGFTMEMDGIVINSAKGLDTWLYGDKFHIEDEKRETWSGWTDALGNDFAVDAVVNVMLARTHSILFLESVVTVVLAAYQSHSVTLEPSATPQ